jgi:uncharacterized protein YcfJ
MTRIRPAALGLVAALLAAGSATAQTYPSVMVTPGPYKPIEVFHDDQRACRDYAGHVIEGEAGGAGDVIGGAFVGTVLGALLGSAADGRHGAGVGAAAGAIAGTAVGAGAASRDESRRQADYDDAYERCMYAHDDVLPGQPDNDAPPPPPPAPARAP